MSRRERVTVMAPSGLQRRKIEVLLDQVEQLPTLPGVARHLLGLLTSESPGRREIQLAIEVDAGLSARAIRLALAQGRPADSLASMDAVLDTVPLDVLAAELLSIEIVGADVARDARLARLWRHILATGMASQIIANRLGTVPPGSALLAGILHDIGQIALAVHLPKAYLQVLDHVENTGIDLLEAERSLLGVDHAVLGRRLARRWGFSHILQNVIWLHHQSKVPAAGANGAAVLVQVVRLADLVARQEGFGYHPTEQFRENPAEVAERLGLSSAAVHQIGHQVASAFELNSQPVGLDDEPTLEELWPVMAAANARLGRLIRTRNDHCNHLEVRSRRADLLVRLNASLAGCHSAREVLETLAASALETLAMRVAVPYLLSREGDYVEGLRYSATGKVEDYFLYDLSRSDSLEPAPAQETGPHGGPGSAIRAEHVEGWLFERQGSHLGGGPFYTVPMVVEQTKVGGIVFTMEGPARELEPHEIDSLVALAGMVGVALTRVQAEADLVTLSEELAEVNRELLAAQEQRLQQRNVASLSEMAAGAAHEINNPLAIISGRAQQLAGDEKNAARREFLRTIIQQAGRISDIITELRQFAQPPAPNLQPVDPVTVARNVTAALTPRADESSVLLRLDAPDAAPPIRIDAAQVAGALNEIVQNAIEACAGGNGRDVSLTVQTVLTDRAVRFVVTDNGPGMEPQGRTRAFDPFYSGYSAGRHRGMGLAKAYRAVQASGGQISLESTPGEGTTVRVTFPLAEAPPAA